ncbi:MAG: glycoside hydrolase family 2 protein [Candidatus Asgardarchaeia archaeon]
MFLIPHPRPDFRRDVWIDLTGKWLFCFDDTEELSAEKLFVKPEIFDLEINVPFVYQSELSGIGIEEEHDVVWYGKRFTIDKKTVNNYKTALLHFGAVDYEAHVWLNGRYLGKHIGGYDPFSFNVSGILSDDNFLIMKVIDRHLDQPRGKQAEKGTEPNGIIYTRVTGIWQPVWLEFMKGRNYLKNILCYPSTNGEVKILAEFFGNVQPNSKLDISVYLNGTSVDERTVDVAGKVSEITLKLDDIELWSPENPNLYDLEISLKNNIIEDQVTTYFGLRTISTKTDKILLNDKPIYLKFVLDQGYYPEGIYTPASVTRFLEDLKTVLELGFNGVRAHQKPPDPRYLYIADSLGVLVWNEMADWGINLTKNNLSIFLKQWRNIIKRDFNHPSIIIWVPFNERIEPIKSEESRMFVKNVYTETKKLDPTRLVVDISGWVHVETDILDLHDYVFCMGTGKEYSGMLNDIDEFIAIVDGTETLDFVEEGFRVTLPGAYKRQPIVISEFGGWGISSQIPIVNRPKFVYAPLEDSFKLENKYKEIVAAIRSAKHITGYCYTQLYDVEGELNGLLTYDRKYKVDPRKIREANMQS